MERQSAGLCPSLQLSHWFLQCHDPLGWARWVRLLWLVTQCEGWRQLQQGCHSAGTCNTRTVQGWNKYSCGWAKQSPHIKSLQLLLFLSVWHTLVTATATIFFFMTWLRNSCKTHTHRVHWTYIAPFPIMKHHKIATWETVYASTIINFNETVTCKTDALTSCNCPAELIVPHGQLVLHASARGLQLDPEPLCFFSFSQVLNK